MMKRIITALVVFTVAVFGVSAGGAPEPDAAADEQVELTLWHIWGGNRVPLMEAAIDAFEAEHPNISVEPVLVQNAGYGERALTALVGGTAPHVMHSYTDIYARAAQNGYFTDVTDLAARDGIDRDDYIAGLWDMNIIDGRLYGLPSVQNGLHFLYWNKDMFREAGLDPDQPPRTWAELRDYSVRLTVEEDGVLERVGFNVSEYNFGAALMFMKFLYANGGQLLSEDGRQVLFDSREGRQTLQYMVDLAAEQGGMEDIMALQTQFIESSGSTYPFFFGREAMILSGVFFIGMVNDAAPNIPWGMVPIPVGPSGDDYQDLVLGAWNYVIPSTTEEQEAAWELLKWISREEGHEEFMKAQLRPSMVREHNEANRQFYMENNANWPTIVEGLDYGVALPVNPISGEIDNIVRQFTEDALYGIRTVDAAIRWGAEEMQAALDEYYQNQ